MIKFPLNIGIGEYQISGHLFFETLAFFIGYRYFLYLRKTQTDKISDSNRLWVLIAAAFGAFFFSRLVGAFENPMSFFQSENKLLYFFEHKTIVGGLLGALLFVELVKKAIGEKYSSGDLFTYPLILAMCIGRIGCFTSGIYEDTYGTETTSLLGMNLGDGLMRHPVSLYEIVYLILLAVFLKFIENNHILKNGYRFQLFMVFYLLFRFSIDFIKPGFRFFLGLGTIQLVCILGLLYYYKIIYNLIFRFKNLYDK